MVEMRLVMSMPIPMRKWEDGMGWDVIGPAH